MHLQVYYLVDSHITHKMLIQDGSQNVLQVAGHVPISCASNTKMCYLLFSIGKAVLKKVWAGLFVIHGYFLMVINE